MSSKTTILTLSAALIGTSLLAHHVPVPLSSEYGTQILTDVVYKIGTGPQSGVLAYVKGTENHSVHDLHSGHGFHVVDQDGVMETVTFEAGDFVDEHDVSLDELVDVLNGKLTVARASIENSHLFLRSLTGGEGASLELIEGDGEVLQKLQVAEGLHVGSPDVRVTLSIPAEEHEHDGYLHHEGESHFAHLPYVLVASTTEGVTSLGGGLSLPFAWDEVSSKVFRATQLSLLDGFFGALDDGADGEAVLTQAQIGTMFGSETPDALHMAFVVLAPGGALPVFVSNRFTVHFED